MGKFFSRFKKDSPDPSVSSLGNLANFYSLLIFLIAIPFILIIALVWLTGVLGFSAWIFAGFAGLCAYIVWRLYPALERHQGQDGGPDRRLPGPDAGGHQERQGRGNLPDERRCHPALHGGPPPGPAPSPAGGPSPWPWRPLRPWRPRPPNAHAWLPPERLREELEEFIRLRDEGVISPEEFDRIKASLLQRMSA